ncbi:hypothetical protein FOB32_22695 [Burkholderia multivorans]|nr:hypothetical protein FOB32_22695 [Burkholderia multivorans]
MALTPIQAIARLPVDGEILHEIVHGPASGPGSVVQTENGGVVTAARAIANVQDVAGSAIARIEDESNDSIAQMQALANAQGYQVPIAYTAGIDLTVANQTVEYNGQTYAPIRSQLPFTTSGAFEADKFRLIQGVSAADLSAGSGSAGVGFQQLGDGAIVRSMEDKARERLSVEDFLLGSSAEQTYAITQAMGERSRLGGGPVELHGVNYTTTGLVLPSNVALNGRGEGVTTVKLADGANAHVITAGDYDTNADGVSKDAPIGCMGGGLRNLTIDGNKANQTVAKNGLAYYGIALGLEHVEVKNSKGVNIAVESPGATFSVTVGRGLQSEIAHVVAHDGGIGNIFYNGQSDSGAFDVRCYKTDAGPGSYHLRFGPKAMGQRWVSVHCWDDADYSWINEASTAGLYNSHMESAGVAKVWMKAPGYFLGGRVYQSGTGALPFDAPAFLIEPGLSNIKIDTTISNCNTGVKFNGADGGHGTYLLQMYNNVPGASPIIFSGPPSVTNTISAHLVGTVTASLAQVPGTLSVAGKLMAGGVDLNSKGIDRFLWIASQGWSAGAIDSVAGSVSVPSSFVVISPTAAVNITDILNVSASLGFLQVTIRNNTAFSATFIHNIEKLRNIGAANKVLGPYESITYAFVSGTVWQQTAGK